MLAIAYDRSLVDACTLVGTLELEHSVLIYHAVVISCDENLVGIYVRNCTCALAQHYCAGVACCLVLDTCSYIRSLGYEQRYCLSLHVGSHQSTVSVVVLEERDHCSSNRYYLLR